MIKIFKDTRIIPVFEIESLDNALPVAEALFQGGLSVIEITLRTDAALRAIQKVTTNLPEIIVGAGTVTTITQAKQAVEMGAKFLVSPGFSYQLVKYCIDHSIPILPGMVTPTEIMMGLEFGLQVCKFFPAEAMGGVKTLRSLSGPFQMLKFIPTGGIDFSNINTYLTEKYVLAVGGSWMATKTMIDEKKWTLITQKTLESVQISQKISNI